MGIPNANQELAVKRCQNPACNYSFMRVFTIRRFRLLNHFSYHLLLLFLLLVSSLKADWDQLFFENEDPTLYHHVNVITGNLNLNYQDAVIQGAKSLPLMHSYSSAGALESGETIKILQKIRNQWQVQAGWNFLPHLNMLFELNFHRTGFEIYLSEPSGNLIRYKFSHQKSEYIYVFKPDTSETPYSFHLSAKGSLENYVLELNTRMGEAFLYLPDGGYRVYIGQKLHHWNLARYKEAIAETYAKCYYKLIREVLPSKHVIEYGYTHNNQIKTVSLKNPARTKTFASMKLSTFKDQSRHLQVTTSDNKSFIYKTYESKGIHYLVDVRGSSRFDEMSEHHRDRKGTNKRLRTLYLNNKAQVHFSYYRPKNKKDEIKWKKNPKKRPFNADKVRCLKAAIGPNREMLNLAQFSYEPGRTDVRDTTNRLTRYFHSKGNLNEIHYFDEIEKLISIVKFIWNGSFLRAKVMLDGNSIPIFSKTFEYDAIGNVTRETLWGALTGELSGPFSLNADGSLEHADHYTKTYSYLPHFNVIETEQEESGLTYRYEYLPDTDLLIAKFTSKDSRILVREFTFYDSDHLPIVEIIDDGISTDPHDITQVTHRQIKRFERDPKSGMILSSTESFLDPISQEELLSKKITYTYSPEKLIESESVYDSQGIYRYTIETRYDPHGNVISKTTPLGEANTYSYDSLNNLISSKEVGSNLKIFRYNQAGRPYSTEERDESGVIKTTYTQYDVHGRLISQTDSKGNTNYQSYDCFGHCIKTQFPLTEDEEGNPCIPEVYFTYDSQGNIISSSAKGGGTTHTTYNALRKPTRVVHADEASTQYRYSVSGALLQTIHPDGTTVVQEYDPFEHMTLKQVFSPTGVLLSSESWTYNAFFLLTYTDPNGLITTYTYDSAGRLIAEKTGERVITTTYDSLGFPHRKTEAEITHVQLYDEGGRVTEEWKETCDGKVENHMWYFYDNENKKIQADRITSQGKVSDFFFYDRELRLNKHVDPNGNVTQFLFDDENENSLGQRVLYKTIIDPLGNQTLEIYDAQDRLKSLEKKDPSGTTFSKEEIYYDSVGNRAKRISTVCENSTPKHQISVRWEYDQLGRVTRECEEADKNTFYSYDERGRLINRLLPSEVSIETSYDGIDRLLEMKSSDGTVHYEYRYGTGPEPIEIFDHVHNSVLKRQYNVYGQLIQETDFYGRSVAWEYDIHGRCIFYTLPDGSSIGYTFKGSHLFEVSRISTANEILYTHTYLNFDPNGNVIEEELIQNAGIRRTIRDQMERPISQESPWLTQSITYGPSSLITSIDHSLYGSKEYNYDPLNQLIQEGEERYIFDSLGNPASCTINGYNQIIDTPDSHLEYDLNGNPILRTTPEGSFTYGYDALNRLTLICHPDGTKTRFIHDPLSRVVLEETNRQKHYYLYNELQEIGELSPSGEVVQLKLVGLGIKGEIGATVAVEIDGIGYVPLNDMQGNIIGLISGSREIIESYEIDAFGKEQLVSTPLNPWRFCSKRVTNDLVLFGKRFYDPSLGRWLTPDPSGFADGANLYVYVLNSPLNRLDLFGLYSEQNLNQVVRVDVAISNIMFAQLFPVAGVLPCKVLLNGAQADWVTGCGFWHQLKFTPDEVKTGTVNIVSHFHELLPLEGNQIGYITDLNGIKVSKDDVFNNLKFLMEKLDGGPLTFGMHTQTQGLGKDLRLTFQERAGKETKEVVYGRQFLVALMEIAHQINPNMTWLHIAHSRGAATSCTIFKGMTDEQKVLMKEKMLCLGLGPANPIPMQYGLKIKNVYSRQDFITGWFALKYVNNPEYDIEFVKCQSLWSERTAGFADHARLGGTYRDVQEQYLFKLRQNIGFYNGKTR